MCEKVRSRARALAGTEGKLAIYILHLDLKPNQPTDPNHYSTQLGRGIYMHPA